MILRNTDIRAALKSRQRGFLLNPFRFGGGGGGGGLQYVGGVGGGGTTNPYTLSLSGTLTGGLSSSPQTGDVVVVVTGVVSTAGTPTPTCSGNNSGAYTLAHASTIESAASTKSLTRIYYKIMAATPDTSLSLIGQTAGFPGVAAVQVWRGVNTTTQLDVSTTTSTGTNSQINAPAITPTTVGAIIIAGGTCPQSTTGAAVTIPANMTNGVSYKHDGSSHDIAAFLASKAWTSGAFDPDAVTGAAVDSGRGWAAGTIVLRPL